MITREEALKELWIMYPESLATEQGYYNVEKLLHGIFDSLESQLSSNPLQLTCEGCKWEYYTEIGEFICKSFAKQNCFRDMRLNDRYTTKDTK